jgi:hypothetical protein
LTEYYALVMEAFPVFGQVERKHARKDERIILAGSNIDAIGLLYWLLSISVPKKLRW